MPNRTEWLFVVRSGHSWYLAPVGDLDPIECDLERVRQEIASCGIPAEQVRNAGAGLALSPVSADTTVRPAWIVVGQMTAAGLATEDPAGRVAVLDSVDLELVDRVVDAVTVGELIVDGLGADEIGHRVSRLDALGVLDLDAPIVESSAFPPVEVSTTAQPGGGGHDSALMRLRERALAAYHLSSKLQPLRDALGHGQVRADVSEVVADADVEGDPDEFVSEERVADAGSLPEIEMLDALLQELALLAHRLQLLGRLACLEMSALF